jgi:hypothetical protein
MLFSLYEILLALGILLSNEWPFLNHNDLIRPTLVSLLSLQHCFIFCHYIFAEAVDILRPADITACLEWSLQSRIQNFRRVLLPKETEFNQVTNLLGNGLLKEITVTQLVMSFPVSC